MTVVGYVRAASVSRVSGGLDAQKARIQAWCDYQGLEPAVIEEDAGSSGLSIGDRPGFRAAVRRVLEAGPGSVLVVSRFDRLGRNAIDVQETLAVLLDAEVRVVSLDEGLDSASGMGTAMPA